MQDSYLDHSIFHAGRYLDDKEICYLPTLILRANVWNELEVRFKLMYSRILVRYQFKNIDIFN